jgi:hypothetical protein
MSLLQAQKTIPVAPTAVGTVITPELHVPFNPSFRGRFYKSLVLVTTLMAAAAVPVLAIPLYVFGLLSMTSAALFVVIPLHIIATVLMARRTPEGIWAGRGLIAGLVAVTAYDALRIPLVITGIWPDFIPRMGGWVVGSGHSNLFVGYLWRYLGDGGGIGQAYFVFCAVLLVVRPSLVTRRPVLLSIGYGVFIWAGLIFTVGVAPRGQTMMFALTPATLSLSLLGHLIYGSVLGLFLRHHARTALLTSPPTPALTQHTPGQGDFRPTA